MGICKQPPSEGRSTQYSYWKTAFEGKDAQKCYLRDEPLRNCDLQYSEQSDEQKALCLHKKVFWQGLYDS